jgi:GrpB-like predicted nucleotidyltransferase (UPF0157 family)
MGFTKPDAGAAFVPPRPASALAHHLHVVQASARRPLNQPLLRDYLRGHLDDAARYGALKRRLAALDDNGDDDTRAMTELIGELTDKVRAERGLTPTPLWEE